MSDPTGLPYRPSVAAGDWVVVSGQIGLRVCGHERSRHLVEWKIDVHPVESDDLGVGCSSERRRRKDRVVCTVELGATVALSLDDVRIDSGDVLRGMDGTGGGWPAIARLLDRGAIRGRPDGTLELVPVAMKAGQASITPTPSAATSAARPRIRCTAAREGSVARRAVPRMKGANPAKPGTMTRKRRCASGCSNGSVVAGTG